MEIFPQGKARDELGKLAGVSGKTYEHAVTVLESAPEPVKNAARKGDLSIHAAHEITKLDQTAQREFSDRISAGEPPKAVIKSIRNRDKQQEPQEQEQPQQNRRRRQVKFRVADFLMTGRENAMTGADLSRLLGQDPRTIREAIHWERVAGSPILADNKAGYFLAETPDEARRFAADMRRRAQEVLEAADGLESGAATAGTTEAA